MKIFFKKTNNKEAKNSAVIRNVIFEKHVNTPYETIVRINDLATKYIVPELFRLFSLHSFNYIEYYDIRGERKVFDTAYFNGIINDRNQIYDLNNEYSYGSRKRDEELFNRIKFFKEQIELMKGYIEENKTEEKNIMNYIEKIHL